MEHQHETAGPKTEAGSSKPDADTRRPVVVRVVLPAHLRTLARVNGEVGVAIEGTATIAAVLAALEAQYPVLQGTMRDHVTARRRPFVRFFACEQDYSHAPPDTPLPAAVVSGDEPFLVVGAMAGG
jgi:molybdopterin converting factor small subunit